MQKSICFFLLFILSHFGFSQTQLEMNNAEHHKFLEADKEMNRVYGAIVKEYKSDTIFISKLKNAQRLWVKFRDAEMEMMYPPRERGYYGSIHPMCWSIYKTELTNQRIQKLNLWLIGHEEGDSCSPSMKIKKNIDE